MVRRLLVVLMVLAAIASPGVARAAEPTWPPASFAAGDTAWAPSSWARFHEISASIRVLDPAGGGADDPLGHHHITFAQQQEAVSALARSGPIRLTMTPVEPSFPSEIVPPCSDAVASFGPPNERPCTPRSTAPRKKRALHQELWFVTLELFAVQTASLTIFAALPSDVSGFAPFDVRNIGKYAAMGPHFDDDRWGFNYVGHPLSGSEYYLIARNRGAAPWQGILYSFGWSAFWEYVTEGVYERASIQDLIVTPFAGAALGEIRYQLRRGILDPRTGRARNLPLRFIALALDPVEAISEALPLFW